MTNKKVNKTTKSLEKNEKEQFRFWTDKSKIKWFDSFRDKFGSREKATIEAYKLLEEKMGKDRK